MLNISAILAGERPAVWRDWTRPDGSATGVSLLIEPTGASELREAYRSIEGKTGAAADAADAAFWCGHVKDWRGFVDAQRVPVPFSPELMSKLWTSLPFDFAACIREGAASLDAFRVEADAAEAIETRSPGATAAAA